MPSRAVPTTSTATLTVEVVYALPEAQDAVTLQLPPGATLRDAVVRSGLLERHPEIDLAVQKLGVFGAPAALDRPLADGDRVEIYRTLVMDPKEARRRRALGNARGKR
jgi:putative ubiquitin-RnfH superfamily antitoxin RatB of RatAB toxin-antitoxin module